MWKYYFLLSIQKMLFLWLIESLFARFQRILKSEIEFQLNKTVSWWQESESGKRKMQNFIDRKKKIDNLLQLKDNIFPIELHFCCKFFIIVAVEWTSSYLKKFKFIFLKQSPAVWLTKESYKMRETWRHTHTRTRTQ